MDYKYNKKKHAIYQMMKLEKKTKIKWDDLQQLISK